MILFFSSTRSTSKTEGVRSAIHVYRFYQGGCEARRLRGEGGVREKGREVTALSVVYSKT